MEVKFKLLSNLNLQLDAKEHAFLEKHFINQETVLYSELKLFKKLQNKMRASNSASYFEPEAFQMYLIAFEASVLKKYFRNYNRYSPVLFLKYLGSKCKWDMGLEPKQEFKLLLKCFVFAKTA